MGLPCADADIGHPSGPGYGPQRVAFRWPSLPPTAILMPVGRLNMKITYIICCAVLFVGCSRTSDSRIVEEYHHAMVEYYETGSPAPVWDGDVATALESLVKKGTVKKADIVFSNIPCERETTVAAIHAIKPFYAHVLDATFGTEYGEPLRLSLHYYPEQTNLVNTIRDTIEQAANTPMEGTP